MPISIGAIGRPRAVAAPGRRVPPRSKFRSLPFSISNTAIAGVTRDSAGAALGNCVLDLFLSPTDQRIATTTSDAAGAYRFDNPGSGPFYLVAYRVGAPDVAGTTINTLTAT
jgi:hypothetical protein